MRGNAWVERRKNLSLFLVIVIPSIMIFYGLVSIWPLAYTVFISFTRSNVVSPTKFIGLGNYRFLLKDPLFWISLWHNISYLLIVVPSGVFLSLIFSTLISKTKATERKLYIMMFFIPAVTSMIAVSLVWNLLYFPKIGLFATLLSRVFNMNPNNLTFLRDPSIALLCIMVMNIWRDLGVQIVIFSAGIGQIPDQIYEAARIDGASPLVQYFRITVPLLKPQILFIVAIYSINAIRIFNPIYMMTGDPKGGPFNSTRVLALQLYNEAFRAFRFGYAAIFALVMLVMLSGLIILQLRSMATKWEY